MNDESRPPSPSDSRALVPIRPNAFGVDPDVRPGWREGERRASEETVDPRRYLAIIRHRWKLVATTFAVVVSAVMVGTLLQPRIYRATGTIELRRQNSQLAPAEAGFEQARIADQHLETQYETLLSDALATRVTSRFLTGGAAGSASEEELQALQEFRRRLMVNPIRGSRIVQISFEAGDPQLAERMVNATIEAYTQMRIESGRMAQERLRMQADSARAQLLEAERRLQEYVREHGLLLLETSGGGSEDLVHERLRYLQQQLSEAEADRFEKESAHAITQARGDAMDNEVIRSLTVRAAELRSEYARLRATFTDDYPRTQQVKNQLTELETMLEAERRRVRAEVSGSYQAARYRQELLRSAFDEQKARADQLAGLTAEYRIIRRDVEAHQQLYSVLQKTHDEASVAAALAATEVGVLSRAVASAIPVRPDPLGNLTLATLMGLIFGVGMAFVREWTDDTVRTPDDASALGTAPVLALIPSLAAGERRKQPRSALAEAFGTLRTSVLFDSAAVPPRSLLVTSTNPREGKTTVAVNLAVSMTKLHRRVLLIDADVRRPAVHTVLGIRGGEGLVDHLDGRADWRSLLKRGVQPGLDVLLSGTPPQNPSELLSTETMRQLVQDAEQAYDLVVIDSPAMMITGPDARILMRLVGGSVLVVRSHTTERELARQVMRQVPNLLGVVLNDTDQRVYHTYHASYPVQRNGNSEPRVTI